MVYTTTIHCQKTELASLRKFIISSLRCTLEDNKLLLFTIAIEEVCMNVMCHSHQYDPAQFFEIKLKINDAEVEAEIVDSHSDFFDIGSYNPPDISQIIKEKRRGSIGLLFVKRVCDSVRVERLNQGGGVCRLTQKIA